MQMRKIGFASVLGILLILGVSGIPAAAFPCNVLNFGPFVDTIVYKVIDDQDQRFLDLIAGDVEMGIDFFSPLHVSALETESDIDICSALRNGYGQFTINCRDYPLNISGLRRAFAFAFDKTAISVDVFGGLSWEHDSIVPTVSGWCVEDDFDWHYYTNQSDIGNQILDDLGFEINETTGFRDAPNGEPFDIMIQEEFPYPGNGIESDLVCYEVAEKGVDALHSLHINASRQGYIGIYGELENHLEYDIVFYGTDFNNRDVDWLAFDYWSEYADVYGENPSNFRNDTFDGWRDQLLYSTTYEEVYEAAAEMQKILHYQVPTLVVYENTYKHAYRNDQFTGHVEDLANGISGPWTMRKIQKLDGTYGGTVPIAVSGEPDNFNIYRSESKYSKAIFDNLYSSLYRPGPNLIPIPDIAESLLTETHDDNPAVPEGHTRFTIDIIRYATWSDGTALTASDVAFTYSYQYESAVYGNPAGQDIGSLVAAYAPTDYRVVLEFNTESYWHFSTFAYDYIIPEHIFNDDTGIGYENWASWNPVLDPAEPHVTCGPYVFSDYEPGEFYEFTYNPLFHYAYCRCHPWIWGPSDITYVIGSTGNEIAWNVSNLDTYSIERDGNQIESGDGFGDHNDFTLTLNIDGLEIGRYTFRLIVTDYQCRTVEDDVIVTVARSIGTTSGTTSSTSPVSPLSVLTTSISVVSAVVILTFVIAVYRQKQIPEAG